jgi:hypothetical protein
MGNRRFRLLIGWLNITLGLTYSEHVHYWPEAGTLWIEAQTLEEQQYGLVQSFLQIGRPGTSFAQLLHSVGKQGEVARLTTLLKKR